VPSTQPSWDETKVTEAAAKPAIGVGAGVAGVADGEAVATGEGEGESDADAVGAADAVPLCDAVGWVVVPPHAATSAASASRPGATPHLEAWIHLMAQAPLLRL
jgi:hypothetical protein